MQSLKSELYKLKKSKLFTNCLGVGALIAAFTAIVFYFSIVNDSDATAQELASTAVELFTTNYSVPFLQILTAIFASIFVSNEFSYGTIKNYISRGVERTDLFKSKLIVCMIAVTFIFVTYNTILLGLGSVVMGFNTALIVEVISAIAITWLLFMAYTAIFVSVAMIVRSNGSAIAINTGIVTFGAIVAKIVEIVFEQLKITIPTDLWIESAISSVTAFPHQSNTLIMSIVTAVIYFVVATLIGLSIFKKSDIK